MSDGRTSLGQGGFGQLDPAALERIQDLSLQVLLKVGVGVDDPAARSTLAEHGARVDEAASRVFLLSPRFSLLCWSGWLYWSVWLY